MNFQQYTATVNNQVVTYTVDAQKRAWDAYINQDSYLSTRRGMYAERNGLLLPTVTRFDLSAMLGSIYYGWQKSSHDSISCRYLQHSAIC